MLKATEQDVIDAEVALIVSCVSAFAGLSVFASIFITKRKRTTAISLILNLLAVDILHVVRFPFTYAWVLRGDISPGTFCDASGFFGNILSVAASMWVFSIGLRNYLAIVHKKRLSKKFTASCFVFIWVFCFSITAACFAMQSPDVPIWQWVGHYCWISAQYPLQRWVCHWIYHMITLASIAYFYGRIIHMLRTTEVSSYTNHTFASISKKLFWYPIIYFVLDFPLALARLCAIPVIGYTFSPDYMSFAVIMYLSNGLVNSVAYGLTLGALPTEMLRRNPISTFLFMGRRRPEISTMAIDDLYTTNTYTATQHDADYDIKHLHMPPPPNVIITTPTTTLHGKVT